MDRDQVDPSAHQWAVEHAHAWWTEHDACAIVCAVRRTGEATHGNLKRTLDALSKMGHRSGDVNGEGDGCGVLTDIPRQLWAETLEKEGKPAWLAEDRRFFVGHLMIPAMTMDEVRQAQKQVLNLVAQAGADLLIERPGLTRPLALGRMARAQAPFFWQIAGLMREGPLEDVEHRLFDLGLDLERIAGICVASLSSHSVVYKVRGSIETLYHYYPELRSPDYTTAITLGHARYSTNTTTTFDRAQPFNLLGHNGEINTIARLREQSRMLGIQLVPGASDSQDVDRTLAALIHHYGFTLIEAMELLFPPILSQVEQLPPDLQIVYRYYRQAFGPFAQGPAAIIARYGDECVLSVDALGLRPLWFGSTEKDYFFSSEKGVYHLDSLCTDPRPLSPGEKMSVRLRRDKGVEVLDYAAMQQQLRDLSRRRLGPLEKLAAQWPSIRPGQDRAFAVKPQAQMPESESPRPASDPPGLETWLAAFGWSREDREWIGALAATGHEPIGSLGHDGPLAALSSERRNLAEYFQEAVAVVTNPSIDRERETEHFSTQCVLGPRPPLSPDEPVSVSPLTLKCPILLDSHPAGVLASASDLRRVANEVGSIWLRDLLASLPVARLNAVTQPGESVLSGLKRLAEEAVQAASSGAAVILLDDGAAFTEGQGWIDPLLMVAIVDRALRMSFEDSTGSAARPSNLRRRVGLVLRSGAIRHLHDLVMTQGLGADAIAPYMLFEVAVNDAETRLDLAGRSMRLTNTLKALRVGLEKVTSTMGIHELRGYGRLFASIGLSQPVAMAMGTANYGGSETRGLTWDDLDADVAARAAMVAGQAKAQLGRVKHFYPKVWKAAAQVARGEGDTQAFERQAESLARTLPVALRHVLDFCFPPNSDVQPDQVDAGLTGHDLPFVFASMSFGSQGEVAFRAYAKAAHRLNIIALNGEGGEIHDMLGKYPHHRGQQIASGRFGVTAELLNSSNLLEIKIGQGAKPGEGGHLPGVKVTAKIAQTRHAHPGIDLISPSNHHDIYSIEDLAQFIEELKTANPKARVAVKVPVVPGIGIIAVGIAKAGADIINLSGYEGGTGAARQHSIRYVGLPAEIGVVEAHRALTEAGLRRRVELWCDGGMRTAADVVKMMCLGANRVGFGTLAMIAIGCTTCRNCQTGHCHAGIATQIENRTQAEQLGLRHFVPRDFDQAVEGLVNLFSALGEGVRSITARLGLKRTQDLVGRSDLLQQVSHHAQLDLSELLLPVAEYMEEPVYYSRPLLAAACFGGGPLRRPRNHLTTVISNLVMETVAAGEEQVVFEDDKVTPMDRALGTHLTGALTRYRHQWMWPPGHGGIGGSQESWRPPLNGGNGNGNGHQVREAMLRFYASSVPGNGLGAYNAAPISIIVEGGAQDGVAKGMQGGRVVILKGSNHDGELIDGSVGKSLAYGATGGLVIVQGDTDSRACIRLSGADVVIGGEIRQPLDDSLGYIGARANVKGFLCEYMTAGRVLVLGDPGPWMCAGMTGGVLYLRLQPHLNLDHQAILRRIARGAQVALQQVDESDHANLHELLTAYAEELTLSHQKDKATQVLTLLRDWRETFVKIVPVRRPQNKVASTPDAHLMSSD